MRGLGPEGGQLWSGGSELELRIHGVPVPQGSKGAKPRFGAGGRVVGAQTFDSNATKLRPWREQVRRVAADVVEGYGWEAVDEPVAVRLVFFMPRPKSTRRDVEHCFRKPDVDKLVRAVFDSLSTAGAWRDDARVVDVHAIKVYSPGHDGTCGVHVRIARAGEENW